MHPIRHLFINTSPDTLFNFNIDDSFLKNGMFEFELLYDIGNRIFNESTADRFYMYHKQLILLMIKMVLKNS